MEPYNEDDFEFKTATDTDGAPGVPPAGEDGQEPGHCLGHTWDEIAKSVGKEEAAQGAELASKILSTLSQIDEDQVQNVSDVFIHGLTLGLLEGAAPKADGLDALISGIGESAGPLSALLDLARDIGMSVGTSGLNADALSALGIKGFGPDGFALDGGFGLNDPFNQMSTHLNGFGKTGSDLFGNQLSTLDGGAGALLHKSVEGRVSPFPGRTYPTASVTGMPSAV